MIFIKCLKNLILLSGANRTSEFPSYLFSLFITLIQKWGHASVPSAYSMGRMSELWKCIAFLSKICIKYRKHRHYFSSYKIDCRCFTFLTQKSTFFNPNHSFSYIYDNQLLHKCRLHENIKKTPSSRYLIATAPWPGRLSSASYTYKQKNVPLLFIEFSNWYGCYDHHAKYQVVFPDLL